MLDKAPVEECIMPTITVAAKLSPPEPASQYRVHRGLFFEQRNQD
jgi:hypothetical protein